MDGAIMTDRPSSRPSWHVAERRVLRELLASPGFHYLRLPPDLDAGYRAHHLALSQRSIGQFWPLVALAYAIIATTIVCTPRIAHGMEGTLAVGFGVIAVAIGFAVVGAVVPRLRPHLEKLVWLGAFIGLFGIHVGTLLVRESPGLLTVAEAGVTYITIATLTISHLSYLRAMAAVVLSTLAFFVVAGVVGVFPRMESFPFYAVAAMLVGSIIGVTNEIRERTVFLQEHLLALEKSELDMLSKELAAQSRQDALTGLSNRRHFDELLRREWAIGERERTELSVLFIDVDFFKRFNDGYGHAAGDECLARVGHALAGALRSFDVVARYGGEEFVVLLPRTGVTTTQILAARLLDAVDDLRIPHESSEAESHVTISIGMATMVPTGEHGPDELLRRADHALYGAKAAGRHRFETANAPT